VTPPPLAPWIHPDFRDRVERYRDAVFQVVELHPRACLGADAWVLLSHQHGDFKDAVHPNQQGLEKLARAMAPVIERHVVRRVPCGLPGNRVGWGR
jgi:lysophospholipase L1-like esterase